MIYTTHGIKSIDDYTGTVTIKGKEFRYFPIIKEKSMYAEDTETGEIKVIKKGGYICWKSTIEKNIKDVFGL